MGCSEFGCSRTVRRPEMEKRVNMALPHDIGEVQRRKSIRVERVGRVLVERRSVLGISSEPGEELRVRDYTEVFRCRLDEHFRVF